MTGAMRTLESYVEGRWRSADSGFTPLVDPCSEQTVAQVSSRGIDFAAALAHARERGGPALRELTAARRGALLQELSAALAAARDELIALSLASTGTTRKDAKFDVDGAIFTLAHYAELGAALGERGVLADGAGLQLGRSARFWGQHVLVPLAGVAVHVNAFNFPVWGFAEKAACALLAGMPVVTKPGTSSAAVAERAVRIVVQAGVLPDGALSLVCGSAGDLLDRLGPQDVLAFTGSASTARELRAKTNLLASSTRVNVEADSLNAAVLGPDVEEGSETWAAFLRDVAREITQKTGQKCTAVRRVLAPSARLGAVEQALVEALGTVVAGNPADASVTMGPLATAGQLDEACRGVALLAREARVVHGSGRRIDGVGNPAGKGFFFGVTLLSTDDPAAAAAVHAHEVFGPVATMMPYDGSAEEAARLVAAGGGTLVTSVYSDDRDFLRRYLALGGAATGRLYVGSDKVAAQLPGSGVALPQLVHGGPGRAGGGTELGGLRGLELYLQRVAVSGDRALVERLCEAREGS
jgi:oxepin-CoA hydrolase/3-oxo-5,6-dehydrosuberyl-CoA semialdehyde dehydrogenase